MKAPARVVSVMLEEREFEGYWWRPSDPDNRIPGTLKFSQDEIRLELLGAFEEIKPGPIGGTDDEPRILGLSKDRKKITLERCLGLGQRINLPGFTVTTYGPHMGLVGAWYEPDEQVRFDEVYARFSDLDTWAVSSGFGHEMHWDAEGKSVTKLDVSYTPPEAVEVPLDDETSLSIVWQWTWSGLKEVTTESRLGQAASFKVSFADAASLERSLEYVGRLRNFLCLGVGRPIQVLSVSGIHLPPEHPEPADPFTKAPPPQRSVEVLYRLVSQTDDAKRDLFVHEMLFSLGDAYPRLEEIVRTWFDRQEIFGPVFNRYFYIVHNQHMAREIQFESFIRALETYHRRSSDATDVSHEEHEGRLEAILSSVPSEHRDWLEKKLAYSNELSLARRLKATLARCPSVTDRLIGTSREDKKSFVRKVVTTRNYEIHLDPDNEAAAATGIELVVLVYQLRTLVEMTLLLDLGFSGEEVTGIFDRIRRYEQVDGLKKAATAEKAEVLA